jgi:regulator of sirC expression with transglutaminase-like and TPR domain
MNVTATDNVAAMMATAQALKNLDAMIVRHAVERKIAQDSSQMQEQRLNRRREELLLDQFYFERAYSKAKIIKGTNVDLYI